tara:strand:- start:9449 stop:11290 length:1842 start_codon:yes stop_codon:yes gene_type:complete
MNAGKKRFLAGLLAMIMPSAVAWAEEPGKAVTNAYFGAVHVHTSYSFDAYTNGTLTSPAQAYQWAQGKAIPGGGGGPDLQLKQALDFYAVSDHAEWLGVFKLMEDPGNPLSKLPMAADITAKDQNTRMQAFAKVLRDFSSGKANPALNNPQVNKTVWKDIVTTADEYYRPGEFTTFPAFEWSSNPDMRNLHRVVLFQNSENLPGRVLSSTDSTDPEHLWAWMGELRTKGATLLAIPHNGNASDGEMFSLQTRDGEPLSEAYIRTRAENEPLYEITQIKGTSETNPALSPNDEFAGFEQWDYTLSADSLRPTHRKGSFARQALLDGLSFQVKGMGNPFHYGFIGDTDTHNAAASNEEYNYTGKFAFENNPAHRLEGLSGQPSAQVQQVREFSSGGLAGVWAVENTREAIYDAMLRRETFGTTGPQIKVRFFGGWKYGANDVAGADFVSRGYAKGVPMGGTLNGPSDKAPSFVVWANKAPDSGNLDRIQIIKGWVDSEGVQQEKIYNVAWSGRRSKNAAGELPAVGNTVDVKKATYSNSIGAAELATLWEDPDFDASQYAFYYVRVLEIPTTRWSTYDAANLGVDVPGGLAISIQERAYTSPIWYQPAGIAAKGK